MEIQEAIQQAVKLGPAEFGAMLNRRVKRPWDYVDNDALAHISSEPTACSARSVLARAIEDAVNPPKTLSQKDREGAWGWLLRPVYTSAETSDEDGRLTIEQAAEAAALPLWQLLEGLLLAAGDQLRLLYGQKAQARLLAAVRSKACWAIN